METRRPQWLAVVLAIMVLCYLVPYTLLRNVDAWYGSLLLWTVATVVVIGINAIVSSAWRD